MNIFIFSGHLGKDPETRQAGQNKVTNFSVAAKSGWGNNEQTLWVKCALWGRNGEEHGLAPYLSKGQKVTVSGEASLRTWQGNEGPVTDLEVRVMEMDLHGDKSAQGGSQEASGRKQEAIEEGAAAGDIDEDIPF